MVLNAYDQVKIHNPHVGGWKFNVEGEEIRVKDKALTVSLTFPV